MFDGPGEGRRVGGDVEQRRQLGQQRPGRAVGTQAGSLILTVTWYTVVSELQNAD